MKNKSNIVMGIDEVGRGCWAGPLVAGAVVLGCPIDGLKDSKLLTKRKREKLAEQINQEASAVGIGWVDPAEIDRTGLNGAVGLAMERALAQIEVNFDELIVDGNINYFPNDKRARAVIKADSSVLAVSAASIVAKVARDNWMSAEAHAEFPTYGFDKHVGYGTKAHLAALQEIGICKLHRLSFKPIQKIAQAEV